MERARGARARVYRAALGRRSAGLIARCAVWSSSCAAVRPNVRYAVPALRATRAFNARRCSGAARV
eukprot:5080340-Lingulodinium_polyedra.AAC.1